MRHAPYPDAEIFIGNTKIQHILAIQSNSICQLVQSYPKALYIILPVFLLLCVQWDGVNLGVLSGRVVAPFYKLR